MTQVPQLVAVLGRGVVPSDSLVVGADDLGLTRGDGVFDATRVLTDDAGSSVVEHLDAHLARFARSIEILEGPAPDKQAWAALIAEAAAAWSVPGEATCKIMWTRGRETVATEPTGLLTITPLPASAIAQRKGMSVATLSRGMASDAFADAPWLLGGAKTLSYAVNVAVKREITRRGADDVLFTSSDGYCLEGPTSSLIAAFGNRLVTTPLGATGILSSITQHVIFDAATAAGWQCDYELMTPAQLDQAEGSWLLSSIRGVAPIHQLDGVELPHDDALTAKVTSWAGF